MKNARLSKTESSVALAGALIMPNFPPERPTVVAEVLMHLLQGRRMTGLDAVFDAATTRLAARVHALEQNYGWSIHRVDRAVACKDGRVTTVKEYFLSPEAREHAMKSGGATWCEAVRLKRLELHRKTLDVKRIAASQNSARRHRRDDGQLGLFMGGAA